MNQDQFLRFAISRVQIYFSSSENPLFNFKPGTWDCYTDNRSSHTERRPASFSSLLFGTLRSLYLENWEAHIWKTEELIFGKLSSSSYVPRNRDQHLNLWTQFKQYPPCCLWLCSMPPLCCEGLLTLEASQIEWRLSSWTGLRFFGRRKRWRGRGCVLSGVGPRT